MRKQRVGTLSLGVLLVALGIIFFIVQINNYQILSYLLTWWPIILILIGGEILWHIYVAKDENAKVRYDVFSIFMIFIIAFSSIGLYALSSVGAIDILYRAAAASDIGTEIPTENYKISGEIEEIIVRAPREHLAVDTSASPEITLFGTARINALNRQEAADFVKQGCKIIAHKDGSKLYISISSLPYSGTMDLRTSDINYTLLLPENIQTRIESSDYYNLKITPAAVEHIRLIDGRGTVNINIDPKKTNQIIETRVSDKSRLSGNVPWNINEEQLENYPDAVSFTGTLQWGKGNKRLTILGAEAIQVNEI